MAGRPRTEIDLNELRKLMKLHCTMAEVAAFYGCNKRTIERRMAEDEEFAEIIEHGRSDGMLSVRRKQFEIMEGGNPTMAIWLGKQLLGQRDQIDTVQEHKPISIEIVNPHVFDD